MSNIVIAIIPYLNKLFQGKKEPYHVCLLSILNEYMREWTRGIDWQMCCRQAPRRGNYLSLGSSIIYVDVHANEPSAFQWEPTEHWVSPSLLLSQHCLAGGWRVQRYTDPFPAPPPPPSWGSNWKIWVALLVCFGGMQWVVFYFFIFLRPFLSAAAP